MIPIVSIFFSFGLPIFALYRLGKGKAVKHPYLYSCGSFGFCIWGIIAQIITIKERLFAGDIGGIEDTIGAVILISLVMMILAVLLNALLLGICHKE